MFFSITSVMIKSFFSHLILRGRYVYCVWDMPLIQYLTVDKTLNYRIKAKVGEQQFALDVRVTIKFQNPKIVSLQIECCAYAFYYI